MTIAIGVVRLSLVSCPFGQMRVVASMASRSGKSAFLYVRLFLSPSSAVVLVVVRRIEVCWELSILRRLLLLLVQLFSGIWR